MLQDILHSREHLTYFLHQANLPYQQNLHINQYNTINNYINVKNIK